MLPMLTENQKGRGGTDFDELLRFANGEAIDHAVDIWSGGRWTSTEQLRIPMDIDGIVYFTDGMAATPSVEVYKRHTSDGYIYNQYYVTLVMRAYIVKCPKVVPRIVPEEEKSLHSKFIDELKSRVLSV